MEPHAGCLSPLESPLLEEADELLLEVDELLLEPGPIGASPQAAAATATIPLTMIT